MHEFHFSAASLHDTDRLGIALARHLPQRTTIALEGTLGAGKTRLVQAIAGGCEIDAQSVTSPTFVLCQPYSGSRQMYHLDAYRIQDLDEFLELGVEEYFEGPCLTLIEWADRVEACLPDDYLKVEIEITGPIERQFRLTAFGPQLRESLNDVAQELSA